MSPHDARSEECHGALQAHLGEPPNNIERRDPTGRREGAIFMISVPDPPSSICHGHGPWLITSRNEGQVPDEVRLKRARGIQAADLVSAPEHA